MYIDYYCFDYSNGTKQNMFANSTLKSKSIEDIRRELESLHAAQNVQSSTTKNNSSLNLNHTSINSIINDNDDFDDDSMADAVIANINKTTGMKPPVDKQNLTLEELLSLEDSDDEREILLSKNAVEHDGKSSIYDIEYKISEKMHKQNDSNNILLTTRGELLMRIDMILTLLLKYQLQDFINDYFTKNDVNRDVIDHKLSYADNKLFLLYHFQTMSGQQLLHFYKALKEFNILNKKSTKDERFIMSQRYNPVVRTTLEEKRQKYLDAVAITFDKCRTEEEFKSVFEARYVLVLVQYYSEVNGRNYIIQFTAKVINFVFYLCCVSL